MAVLCALYSMCHCAPVLPVDNSETHNICTVLLDHPPHVRLITFNPVSGVRGLSRHSLNQLYKSSWELLQGVGILKQELVRHQLSNYISIIYLYS